jgi:uncharacterized protein
VALVTGPLASSLHVGWTRHRRLAPIERTFRYRTFHALLDLDELPALEREVAGFAYRRPALVRFRDRDHLGAGDTPVKAKLARWLRTQGHELPEGPVRVLANLRVLGHVFDPVSWWFCHHADGSLALVVAEVRNTFGESYWYLLDDLNDRGGGVVQARAAKRFHVSPFLPIDGLTYRFTFVLRPERIVAHIDVLRGEELVFDATQTGLRRDFTTRSLLAVLLANPLLPLRTVVLIHLQAVRLLARRVRFHRKPEPPTGAVGRGQREPAAPVREPVAATIPAAGAHEPTPSAGPVAELLTP